MAAAMLRACVSADVVAVCTFQT